MVNDIKDNERDKAKLQPDETILDLPDVEDIPGQEHIIPPQINEMADVTIASDDEEGVGLFRDDDDDDLSDDTNVSATEKELLRRSSESMESSDDRDQREAT